MSRDSEAPSSSPATMPALQEATGDSESDSAADGSFIDADEGDAESCCGDDDDDDGDDDDDDGDFREELRGRAPVDQHERRIVSWGCWMMESVNSSAARHMVAVGGAGEGACPSTEVAAEEDAESGRLFWEACIAHGY